MSKSERHHDLDALRSTMLLLGLLIHAGEAYFPFDLRDPELWFFYDSTSSSLAAPLSGAIHVYRMPVFFVLAGFFAAMLVSKRGIKGLLTNRIKRVAAPLAAALLTIIPLIYFAASYAASLRVGAPDEFLFQGFDGVYTNKLLHLWFLWHLVLLYVGTWMMCQLIGLAKDTRWYQTLMAKVDATVNSNWAVPMLAIASLPLLTQMQSRPGCLDTTFDIVPPLHTCWASTEFATVTVGCYSETAHD